MYNKKKRGKHTWDSQCICIASVCPHVSLLHLIAVKVVVYKIYLILNSRFYVYNKKKGGKTYLGLATCLCCKCLPSCLLLCLIDCC